MTLIERIGADLTGPSRDGHDARYRIAAGYVEPTDRVLDAACGVGYGVALVPQAASWLGVDIADVVDDRYRSAGEWVVADLDTWKPHARFDVALSFETLEHVKDPDRLIATLCRARRLVVCSVPVVPTVGGNPFHLHDFEVGDLPRRFAARHWRLRQLLLQPAELSAVYVFTQ